MAGIPAGSVASCGQVAELPGLPGGARRVGRCLARLPGFFYLVAVMDWASRFVLSWELENTMEVGFCVSAMEEALRRYGAPSISNTDQGSRRPLAIGRSRARRSCARCSRPGYGSAWTARGGGWTTGLWSAYGGR